MQVVTPLRPEAQQSVQALYEKLQKGYRAQPNPTAREREDRLDRLDAMVAKHREELAKAVSEDFSGRSRHETLLADVVTTLDGVREARRHLREWMRKRPVDPSPLLPALARLRRVPAEGRGGGDRPLELPGEPGAGPRSPPRSPRATGCCSSRRS